MRKNPYTVPGSGKKAPPKGRWKRVILVCAMICSVLFLLVCLAPFLPADEFWPVALLGYLFPLILVLVFIFLLVLAIQRSRWVFLPLITLVLGFQQIRSVFAVHFFTPEFQLAKSATDLRVMMWNVSQWDQDPRQVVGDWTSSRGLMLDLIEMYQADLLCLQEFFEPNNSAYYSSNIAALKEKGYPYHHFFPNSITYSGKRMVGLVIFSKHPILDSAVYSFGKTPHSEGLISADIRVREQTIRVFVTHLESSRTGGKGAPSPVDKAHNVISRLKLAYEYRAPQARLVAEKIRESPHPVLLCGNLGDLPNSYAYFTVKSNLQDAFLKRGAGFGRTYRFMSPTIRVDYILASKAFLVKQFAIPDVRYSDHYPLISDLEIRRP